MILSRRISLEGFIYEIKVIYKIVVNKMSLPPSRICYMGCEKFTRLFNFPKDEESRLVWLKALGRENEHNRRTSLKLCDRHFSRKMLTRLGHRLLNWAVPDVPPGLEEYNVENREILSAEQDMIHEIPTKQQLQLMHEYIRSQDLQNSSELSQLPQSPILIEHSRLKQIPQLDLLRPLRAETEQEQELILDDDIKNDENSMSENHPSPSRYAESSATDTRSEISITSLKPIDRNKRRRRTSKDGEYLTKQLSRILETHLSSGDEYDYFFKNMAFRVRKLQSEKARSCVQKIFSNIMFDAEMGKYDDGIPSSGEVLASTLPLVDIKTEPIDN